MGLRPAHCYRKLENRPHTRQSQKKPKKSYAKGVPGSRLTVFITGDRKKKFEKTLYLLSKNPVQIRHNAMEAARISVGRFLEKKMGVDNYYMRFLVYPHHIMRENPVATGAGADRFSTGMRKSYGKPIGLAARVKAGQRIMQVSFQSNFIKDAKDAMKIAAAKFPTPCMVEEAKPA